MASESNDDSGDNLNDPGPTGVPGYSESQREKAIGQLNDRIEKNTNNLKNSGWENAMPGVGAFNVLNATVGNYSNQNMIDKLNAGGDPVFDSAGNVKGVYSDDGLFGGRVYSGDPNFGPNPPGGPGGEGGGGNTTYNPGPDPLQLARDRRATALAEKQKELAEAFANTFSDDYYGDLSSSYSDFAMSGLQEAYDDSLRGIYQGFKAAGLMSQDDLNTAISGLDTQKGVEQQRINDAAAQYAEQKKADAETQRQKFGDELTALVGGATTQEAIDAQTANIQNFDVTGRIDKAKAPGAKNPMEFFQGYDKVKADQVSAMNPTATYTQAPGAASLSLKSGASAPQSLVGVSSPFQGNSVKVVS